MRLDTANRSLAGLVGISLAVGVLVFCGAAACVLVALVAARVADDGLASVVNDGRWVALVFVAVIGAGAVMGAWSLRGQIRASARLRRRIGDLHVPLPPELAQAATRTNLVDRVILVDSLERFSFAYGALTPRVVVSRGLLEAASLSELDAVLQHERYHVRNLDPLKVLVAETLSATFFYVPVLHELKRRYVAGRELAADRHALAACGRRPLAGALLKVVRGPEWAELSTAAAIGGPELLDVRVTQLETGTEPTVATPTATSIALSLLGAILLTVLFATSVAAFGGPSAVARTSGTTLSPLNIGGALMCATPWAVSGWLGYRWLVRRTRG